MHNICFCDVSRVTLSPQDVKLLKIGAHSLQMPGQSEITNVWEAETDGYEPFTLHQQPEMLDQHNNGENPLPTLIGNTRISEPLISISNLPLTEARGIVFAQAGLVGNEGLIDACIGCQPALPQNNTITGAFEPIDNLKDDKLNNASSASEPACLQFNRQLYDVPPCEELANLRDGYSVLSPHPPPPEIIVPADSKSHFFQDALAEAKANQMLVDSHNTYVAVVANEITDDVNMSFVAESTTDPDLSMSNRYPIAESFDQQMQPQLEDLIADMHSLHAPSDVPQVLHTKSLPSGEIGGDVCFYPTQITSVCQSAELPIDFGQGNDASSPYIGSPSLLDPEVHHLGDDPLPPSSSPPSSSPPDYFTSSLPSSQSSQICEDTAEPATTAEEVDHPSPDNSVVVPALPLTMIALESSMVASPGETVPIPSADLTYCDSSVRRKKTGEHRHFTWQQIGDLVEEQDSRSATASFLEVRQPSVPDAVSEVDIQVQDTAVDDNKPSLNRKHQGETGKRKREDEQEIPDPKPAAVKPQPPNPPNPKRPTAAYQRLQHKKLIRPFRSPVINAPNPHDANIRPASINLTPLTTSQVSSNSQPSSNSHAGGTPQTTSQVSSDSQPSSNSRAGGSVTKAKDVSNRPHAKKHRTQKAASQFKSPLCAGALANDVPSVRQTPSIQALESRVQILKRAIKVKEDNQDQILESLVKKWREAGREVAWEVWSIVKDRATNETSTKSWGFGDDDKYGGGQQRSSGSWGWGDNGGGDEQRMEGDSLGREDTSDMRCVADEDEKAQDTLGTMLRQMGIAPETLGWDEEEGTFVDV